MCARSDLIGLREQAQDPAGGRLQICRIPAASTLLGVSTHGDRAVRAEAAKARRSLDPGWARLD